MTELEKALAAGEDTTGLGTVQDLARCIIEQADANKTREYPIAHPYWCELGMNVDGKKVKIEVVVTRIDGEAKGKQYQL